MGDIKARSLMRHFKKKSRASSNSYAKIGLTARARGADNVTPGASSMSAVLASAVRHFRTLLAHAAAFLAIGPANTYRPEAYYMRGPGPKWREKHAQPRRH